MIRVLVDDRWSGLHGIGRYSGEILLRTPDDVEIKQLNTSWALSDPTTPIRLGLAIRRIQPQIFWSPGFIPPLGSDVPFVFTIHDLIHLHSSTSLHSAYFNSVIRPLSRRAARVITVSEFSRSEICEWAGLNPDVVSVVPNGVSKEFRPEGERRKLGSPYILYVGNRKPHKNLARLLSAYALSGLSADLSLVLSGSPDRHILRLAAILGIESSLIFTGELTEAQMACTYRGATAVALVSTCEGFGLPALEAMACGTPVLVSDRAALPEVVGEAGVLVDPYSVESIAEGLSSIVSESDLRSKCSLEGIRRSRDFSWNSTARTIWRVLKEIVGESKEITPCQQVSILEG